MHLGTVKIAIDFGFDWPRTSASFLISKLVFLLNFASLIHLCRFDLFSGTIASETHRWLSSHPKIVGSMWGVFKPSVLVRIRSMQWKKSGIHPVAVGISRTSGQISLKISVAMNDQYYRHWIRAVTESEWLWTATSDYGSPKWRRSNPESKRKNPFVIFVAMISECYHD